MAPYSSVFSSLSGTPSSPSSGLEARSPEKLSCQAKTAMFATISSTVMIGNRPVGMLSLSGIRGREAYFSGMSPNQRAG